MEKGLLHTCCVVVLIQMQVGFVGVVKRRSVDAAPIDSRKAAMSGA